MVDGCRPWNCWEGLVGGGPPFIARGLHLGTPFPLHFLGMPIPHYTREGRRQVGHRRASVLLAPLDRPLYIERAAACTLPAARPSAVTPGERTNTASAERVAEQWASPITRSSSMRGHLY